MAPPLLNKSKRFSMLGDMDEKLGERIARLRENAGMLQKELGRLVGLSESAISNLEKGKVVDLKMTVAVKMARVFAITVEELDGSSEPCDPLDLRAQNDEILRDLIAEWRAQLGSVSVDRLREMREVEDPEIFRVVLRAVATAMASNVDAATKVAAVLRAYRGEG